MNDNLPRQPNAGNDNDVADEVADTSSNTRTFRAQKVIVSGVIALVLIGLVVTFFVRDDASPTPVATPTVATVTAPQPSPTPAPSATPRMVTEIQPPQPALASAIEVQRTLLRSWPGVRQGPVYDPKGRLMMAGNLSPDARWVAWAKDGGVQVFAPFTPTQRITQSLPPPVDSALSVNGWSPDSTAFVASGFAYTEPVTSRNVFIVQWDSQAQVATPSVLTLDEKPSRIVAFWSPNSSRVAIINYDSPTNLQEGQMPRYVGKIYVADKTGRVLAKERITGEKCCWWTANNHLIRWDDTDAGRAGDAHFYTIRIIRPDDPWFKAATRLPALPMTTSKQGQVVVAGASAHGGELLVYETTDMTRLALMTLDNRKITYLAEVSDFGRAVDSPDVPITALQFNTQGSGANLWFYDWAQRKLFAARRDRIEQLIGWDRELRGFTAITRTQDGWQLELIDADVIPRGRVEYLKPVETFNQQMRRLWRDPTHSLVPLPSGPYVHLLSPDHVWQAMLDYSANESSLVPQGEQSSSTSAQKFVAVSLIICNLISPTQHFTKTIAVENGRPINALWAPDSQTIAVPIFDFSADSVNPPRLRQVRTYHLSDTGWEESIFVLPGGGVSRWTSGGQPMWSQTGHAFAISTPTHIHIVSRHGTELLRVEQEPDGISPVYLSHNALLTLDRNGTLRLVSLDEGRVRPASGAIIHRTDPGYFSVLDMDASGERALVCAMPDNQTRHIAVLNFADGVMEPILRFSDYECYDFVSAGSGDSPTIAFKLRNWSRVFDQAIWFYNWQSGRLHQYERPARLLGWNSQRQGFMIAAREEDGFYVELLQLKLNP